MKIAVCYSGFIRIFKELVDSHVEHLLSKFDCDVFLDSWNTYGNGGHKLKYEADENDLISEGDIQEIINKINPVEYNFEDYSVMEAYFKDMEKDYYEGHPYARNILSMFYKIKTCNQMVLNQNKVYDAVLRLRCDHQFTDNFNLTELNENTIYTNGVGAWSDQIVNDQFFYGKQEVMTKATSTYDKLDGLYKRGHLRAAPEYLFYLSLIENGLIIDKKPINYYKLIRAKGQEYH